MPANWTAGVPTTSIDAWIDNGGTTQIELPGAVARDVFVGRNSSNPSFLEITGGGTLANRVGYLGYGAGSQGTATVTGSGSLWTSSFDLYIGRSGTGKLTIEDGGRVSTYLASYLGYESGSQGTVIVTDTGATWTDSVSLHVGYTGTGTMTIAEEGHVSSVYGYLGYESGSQGTVTVSGSASMWTNSSDLCVGHRGAGTLTIEDGGHVSNANSYLGSASGSQGTVTVSGSGSMWTNSSGVLYVGLYGAGTLTVADGARVSSRDGYLGFGSQGTATVSGSGSKWTNSYHLHVGTFGTGTLTIADGGELSSLSGNLGWNPGSHGTATVSGNGSKWTNSTVLYVGHDGTGTLTIENGGQVLTTSSYLGQNPGSQGTAMISGSGSKWMNMGFLYLGVHAGGPGGTGALVVKSGGTVQVYETLKVWDTSTLTLDGGQINTGSFQMAAGTTFTHDSGTLTVFGGTFDPGTAYYTIDGPGNPTVQLTGATATLSDVFVVADTGSGTLTIEDGGHVSNTYGFLGYYPGSQGTATVTGSRSTWRNSHDLYVGSSGTGTLTVADGGEVSIGETVAVGTLGTIYLADGGIVSSKEVLVLGTLHVNGSLTAALEVNTQAGSTLSGSGTIVARTVTISGILAPGSGFSLGVFDINDYVKLGGDSTLGISSTVAAVPEPGTWAMLLAAFIGLALWHRRRKV